MLLTLMITIMCFDFHVISSNDEHNIMLTLMLKISMILTRKWISRLDTISIDEYVVSSLDLVNHGVHDDNKSKLSI